MCGHKLSANLFHLWRVGNIQAHGRVWQNQAGRGGLETALKEKKGIILGTAV
jgi:hypothetical protein